jgi:hypothetical protein
MLGFCARAVLLSCQSPIGRFMENHCTACFSLHNRRAAVRVAKSVSRRKMTVVSGDILLFRFGSGN